MKPKILTTCPAAARDTEAVRTAELSWPACGPAHTGALLQLSTTVLPTGQHVALVDVYRADAQVLVRCAPAHMQAPGLPLGTTLERPAQELLELVERLQQVAADAEALLDALDGVQLDDLPAVVLASQRLHHSVQDALEVENA